MSLCVLIARENVREFERRNVLKEMKLFRL